MTKSDKEVMQQARDSYEMIDRFLRDNLYDDDYAEYSAALDSVMSIPVAHPLQPGISAGSQCHSHLINLAAWLLSPDATRSIDDLEENTHIGHRQFQRAQKQTHEVLRIKAIEIRKFADQLAVTVQPVQPVSDPKCPCCEVPPLFSLDTRVNEWEGFCKHCGVSGPLAATEAEAMQKWVVQHHKPIIAQPVQPAADLDQYITANYPNAEGNTLTDRVIFALEKMDIALGMKEFTRPVQTTPKITAYMTSHDEGDMLFFDKDEALQYCEDNSEPESLVLLSDIAQPKDKP